MKTCIFTLYLLVACLGNAQTVTDYLNVPNPGSIEVDAQGNLWVSYRTTGVVDTFHLAKVTPWGLFIPVIKETYELGPFGVNDNFIWISSTANGKVYKYTRTGIMLDSVNVSSPEEIILFSEGTWYMSQSQSGRVVKYSPSNNQYIVASGLPLNNNIGLAFDEYGLYYTSNRYDGNVVRVNPESGAKSVIASLPTHTPYSLGFLTYRDGYVYVASAMSCIYKADTSGMNFEVFAGVEGIAGDSYGDISTALMAEPIGLAFSVTGDTLFVSDATNNKIKAIYGMNSLGVNELSANEGGLSLYPNPASESVSLSVKNDQIADFRVTDANGKAVEITSSVEGNKTSVDISRLVKGTYFVRILTEKGLIIHSIFLKT